jgi:chemotaxis protein histidine kinase CheA
MLNASNNQELESIFYEEAQSLIDRMRKDISALREKQESGYRIDSLDGQPDETSVILERLLRNAHTIKGNSGTIGYEDLRQAAKSLENIIKSTIDEESAVTASVIFSLAENVEACQKLLLGKRQ